MNSYRAETEGKEEMGRRVIDYQLRAMSRFSGAIMNMNRLNVYAISRRPTGAAVTWIEWEGREGGRDNERSEFTESYVQ